MTLPTNVDKTPTAKVAAGALTGAAITCILTILRRFDVELTMEEAAAAVTLLSGVVAWWKRSRPGDVDF